MKRNMNIYLLAGVIVTMSGFAPLSFAQHGESNYKRPEGLIHGGAFKDLIEPMLLHDGLDSNVWGGDNVKPREAQNGIEDAEWSYWGGNVVTGSDGKEHLFVCRWREDGPRGHCEWQRNSKTVHAVSDKPTGPFTVIDKIGPGYNTEIYRAKDGNYVVYTFGPERGLFISKSLDGPWERRANPLGVNTTFTEREDGSVLAVTHAGLVLLSENGYPPFTTLVRHGIYPKVEGARFEDPVIWRDEVQYHLIVNDWFGRTAYYMRSKDGLHWKWAPGKAYDTKVVRQPSGRVEGWYKLERPKVRRDKYGRATHIYFAVIDCPKAEDKTSDMHSSKNTVLPLVVGRRLAILNKEAITSETREILLKIKSEDGFNPHTDIDIPTLAFGAPEVVDFGKGCKPLKTQPSGKDLIVVFSGKGNGITDDNFTGKLMGKTSKGELLYGYARLHQHPASTPSSR